MKKSTKPFNFQRTPPGTVNLKISLALVDHVYQLLRVGQLTSLFCATIILFGLYDPLVNNNLLFFWYGFYLTITIMRMIFFKVYSLQEKPDIKLWKALFIFGALLGGLSWGLSGSLLFIHATAVQQTLLILILAGITAGATPLLAADLTAAIAFISAALIPPALVLCLADTNTAYPLFGIGAIGYYLYLLMLSARLHRIIKESISLKFENDALIDNISQTKNQLVIINKKLAHAATHDPLTNLANRSLFEFSLTKAIQRAKNSNRILALMYIDLDNFKNINDTYGHHVGDQLLLQLIERISNNTRRSDTVARLGGDELTVILENIDKPDTIHVMAERFCRILSEPVHLQDKIISVTASIGISIFPGDGDDVETLLKNADRAMYYVKEHGRNNFRFHSTDREGTSSVN